MTERKSASGGGGIVESIIGAAAKAIEGVTAAAVDTSQIREQMEVIGSDGQHVGVVDHLEGDQIKLARNDPGSGGQHHYVPVGQVDAVVIRLAQPAEQVRQQWEAEPSSPSSGLR
jgi:hypothetical protein